MTQETDNRRTSLVTGATSGIGLAIAERLLQQGFEVVGVGRDFSKCGIVHENFKQEVMDFAELTALKSSLKQLPNRQQHISSLILCAGVGQFGSLEEFSYEQMQHIMNVNFTAQAMLVRAFLPMMKKNKCGDIVFIGSESALSGGRRGAMYCASKFAIRGFAQALRDECAKANIRVSVINPGMVQTPFFDTLHFTPGEAADNYVTAQDVADAVLLVLNARSGTVFDEINLSPQKTVISFK